MYEGPPWEGDLANSSKPRELHYKFHFIHWREKNYIRLGSTIAFN